MSDLFFSDSRICAFLAAIVSEFEHQHPDRELGRLAMQKLTYFATVLGTPIPAAFEIYTYGPYSSAVTFAIDSMLADDVIVDESGNPRTSSNYRTGQAADDLLSRYAGEITPHEPAIAGVVKALGAFKPKDLELVATLHFIHHRLKKSTHRTNLKEQVLTEFRRVKGDKFAKPQVETFHRALEEARLL